MASIKPPGATPDPVGFVDLLYQALETEQGGIKVYETAITCALNDDLREEWEKYLAETRRHEEILLGLLGSFGLDPETRTPGREVVAGIGAALVEAMEKAKATATPAQAQLVACECVVHAETKDHQNWELLEHIVKETRGDESDVLKPAVEEVERQEDHHYYHTRGWCRELWIQALGFEAVLPPPEEKRNVESMIGAAKAEQQRDQQLQ